MTIIAITGSMGSGKTLLMTIMAHKYYSDKRIKASVYANYGLNFPFKPLHMKDIADAEFDFSNAVLALDELHLFMDSRQSGTKKNRIISYFITQSRKRNIIFIYTTQQSHQIDKRLRSNTDYFINCENLTGGRTSNVFIRYTINDMKGHSQRYIFKADPFFHLYDTHQMIDFTQ